MNRTDKPPVVVSWSSGKDSAFALHRYSLSGEGEVVGALTTLNEEKQRVAMHGVRRELLQRQLEALDLPVTMVMLPMPCDEATYRQRVGKCIEDLAAHGVRQMIFGDLFLEDVRRYRETNLQGTGIEPVFPLWQRETATLAREMVDCGLRAIIATVDTKILPAGLVGRTYDHSLLDELPGDVDPCGENGEFHTVVTAGPMFSAPIPVRLGETVIRGEFAYIDVIPVDR